MKKSLAALLCICVSAFVFVLTDLPKTAITASGPESAYAENGWGGWHRDKHRDSPPVHRVPEPSTLALLGSGIAGFGMIKLIRRKKNVK